MMTNEEWYESIGATAHLTQGDIIFDCPVVCWSQEKVGNELHDSEALKSSIDIMKADVIVMTQACDLEQNKVQNVILCPHIALDDCKPVWECTMQEMGQNPSLKAWKNYCEDIKNGYVWNLAMLNCGNCDGINISHRIVDFHEVYTLPRIFLESLLQVRSAERMRLRAPYREHLSQAFARYFMRVGLPTGITRVW